LILLAVFVLVMVVYNGSSIGGDFISLSVLDEVASIKHLKNFFSEVWFLVVITILFFIVRNYNDRKDREEEEYY